MAIYRITARLDNGNEIHARVEARNRNDALVKLRASAQYREFCDGHEPTHIEATREEMTPNDNDRYIIKAIDNQQGWCVCIDTDRGLRLEWRKGQYNDKQRSRFIGQQQPPPLEAATALREMGDFLQANFAELL